MKKVENKKTYTNMYILAVASERFAGDKRFKGVIV